MAIAGVTATDTRDDAGTVINAVADLPPTLAVIVAEPLDTAFTAPLLAMTVATDGVADVHSAELLRSTTLLSE